MKIFISADMEGISGITDPTYLRADQPNYKTGQSLMTHDVNAVIEAALEHGATEIVVADSHSRGNNLLFDQLHPKARLISGFPRNYYMMTGLDSSFSAAFFVGYHVRHRAPGLLSHTYSFKNIYVNGQVVGEIGFNAVYAGMLGVPVTLVTGDDRTAEEVRDFLPNTVCCTIKQAISHTSALCFSLEESRSELMKSTREAMENIASIPPVQTKLPAEISIELLHTGQAELAASLPQVSYQEGSTVVSYLAHDHAELYRTMETIITLVNTARFF